MRWKKFLRWQFAEVCEAAKTDLRNVFQICSSNAFGLASPLVSRKPSRPQPSPTAQNESTAFAESLRAVEHVRGRKQLHDRPAPLSNSLSARSLGMVERLIPNSEQCALCRRDRAIVAAVGYRGLHPPVNDRRCGATGVDDSAVTLPFSRHRQSA